MTPLAFLRRRRARREAISWAVRRADDTPPANDAFEGWLRAEPDHPGLYSRFSDLLADPALAEALAAAPVRTVPTKAPLRPMLAAAAFAVLALAAWFARPYFLPVQRLETEIGQRLAATLPDGTHVELNGDSALVVSFRDGHRQVTLERGECFFDVAHDEKRPFQVLAGDARLTVLGTAFDVDRRITSVELSVYRGKVDMGPAAGDGPHDQAVVGQRLGFHAGTVGREAGFDPEAGDWRDGWLDTAGMTLGELAEQLNRRGPARIDIEDTELARLKVAGRFRIADPDHLVARLAALYRFQAQYASGKLVLSR